jgi:hypothetical protein
MDKAKIEETLDMIIELGEKAKAAKNEFYSLEEQIWVAQASLRFKSVKFVHKGYLFEFNNDAKLCNLNSASGLDDAMPFIDTDPAPIVEMYKPKNMLEDLR